MNSSRLSLILLVLLTIACTSVDKLVDRGNYDQAIEIAVRKLAGNSSKSSKDVKALEKAMAKANAADMDRINFLKSQSGDTRWDQIYESASKIDYRQELVYPLLPLSSKDGYRAKIDLLPIKATLSESQDKAAELFYNNGVKMLEDAQRLNDKRLASEALYNFQQVASINPNQATIREKILLAEEASIHHVLIRWDEASLVRLPVDLQQFLREPEIDLGTNKVRYYTSNVVRKEFDLITTLTLADVFVTPENQDVNRYTDKDRIERLADERTSVGADSVRVIERTREVTEISAEVELIRRSKASRIVASAETRDGYNTNLVIRDNLTSEVNFSSEGGQFTGDRRALSAASLEQVNKRIEPFPTDYQMLRENIAILHDRLRDHLRRLRL